MITGIAQIALIVRDYDEAKNFYCGKLQFQIVEDTPMATKRWIRLRAPGGGGSELLLSRAETEEQKSLVGKQAGGRVLFFMHTNDIDMDCAKLRGQGVEFTEQPRREAYGTVAVMKDLYGNRIDLIQPR